MDFMDRLDATGSHVWMGQGTYAATAAAAGATVAVSHEFVIQPIGRKLNREKPDPNQIRRWHYQP